VKSSADQLLDVMSVAGKLMISKSYVYKLVGNGSLPQPRKLGRRIVWPAKDIAQYINALPKANIGMKGK
jgi:predicted DNA-binding transcriptional regulator AlpA